MTPALIKPLRKVPYDIAAPLLLLSRQRLTAEDEVRARDLLAGISDWPMFLSLAREKFSLPFVAAHVARLCPQGGPGYDAASVRAEVTAFAFAALRVAAAQLAFHRSVIEPLGVEHVYVKGPTLAARYYGDLGLRYARDVDVLVEPGQFAKVLGEAHARGYRLFDLWNTPHEVIGARDLRAAQRYMKVAVMLSPDGVTIEVHRELDPEEGLFSTTELFHTAVDQPVQGVVMRTLPDLVALLYVAHHSTRHAWSKLHWLADLDAIAGHGGVDLAEGLAYAEQRGMRPMLEACLTFRDLTRNWTAEQASGAVSPAGALLDLCLSTLDRGHLAELEWRDRQTMLGVPYPWLLEPALRRRVFLRRLRARFRPSYHQYRAWPLPESLQWLYYITRPGGGVMRRLPGGRG